MIETRTVNGFTVQIDYDYDCASPRDDESPGCQLVLSKRNADLPNDAGLNLDLFGSWQEVARHLLADGALMVLPVWAYEHSGIALSVGARTYPFDDQWDSGQAGVAYITRENWADTEGTEWTGSQEQQETAEKLIRACVGIYGQYLNGECYGYRVRDFDGEVLADCWGFIGSEAVDEAADEAANSLTHQPKCTGTLDRYAGEIDHDRECPIHSGIAPP